MALTGTPWAVYTRLRCIRGNLSSFKKRFNALVSPLPLFLALLAEREDARAGGAREHPERGRAGVFERTPVSLLRKHGAVGSFVVRDGDGGAAAHGFRERV